MKPNIRYRSRLAAERKVGWPLKVVMRNGRTCLILSGLSFPLDECLTRTGNRVKPNIRSCMFGHERERGLTAPSCQALPTLHITRAATARRPSLAVYSSTVHSRDPAWAFCSAATRQRATGLGATGAPPPPGDHTHTSAAAATQLTLDLIRCSKKV